MVRDQYYGLRHDVWGLGVLSFFLFSGQFPFDEDSDEDNKKKILEAEPDWKLLKRKKIDPRIILLIGGMLEKDPSKRLTIRQVMSNRLFEYMEKTELKVAVTEEKKSIREIGFPNLNYISKMDLLQDAVLKFYAHNLIEVEELKKIKAYFMEIDKNGDGMLTIEEIEEIMTDIGRKDEAKNVFEMMDYKKNNVISYEEFIKALIDRKEMKSKENIKRCFEAIDLKQDGKLSMEEVLKIVFTSKNSSEIKEFKQSFKIHSKGKSYVSVISCPTKILLSLFKVSRRLKLEIKFTFLRLSINKILFVIFCQFIKT